jgi:outer membrane protein
MKKSVLLISGLFMILSLLFYSTFVMAGERVGVYNLQQIVTQCDAGKKDIEILKKMEIDKSKPIEEKNADAKKLKEDLDKQKSILTEASFTEKQVDLQKKMRDIEIMAKDATDEMKLKQEEMLKKLLPEIEKVIKIIAEKGKYTMIIDSRSAVYFSKDVDLTEEVIEELNKSYKPEK